jgi:Transglycosylase SLT domain
LRACILAALIASAPSSGFASVAPVAAGSEFAKEQAMTPAQLIERWAPFIKEASRRFKISADWIRAVMRMESGGRTLLGDKTPITSTAGAMGIMQVMPDTYSDMREQYGLGADPFNPRDNILAGAAYLSWLHDKYGYPKMFAAYNAGPGTLDAQLAGSRKLPKETRDYIKGIASILGIDEPAAAQVPQEPIKVIATFTRPNGTTVTIDAETVTRIRAPVTNEFMPGVQAVVMMGERMQAVLEDVTTVASTLKRPAL